MKKATVVISIVITFLLFDCNERKRFTSKTSEEGYQLASTYCKSCHQFPKAELLDKKTWANHVLPKMGGMLGFMFMDGGTYFERGKGETLKIEEWNKILVYYLQESPEMLKSPQREPINLASKLFIPFFLDYNIAEPTTTFVSILPGENQFYFGDGISEKLYWANEKGVLEDSLVVGVGLVHVQIQEEKLIALTMGVLHPSDEKSGKLVSINKITKEQKTILDSLQRPVFVEYADLNNNLLSDILVSEFGNITGQLSWFENKGKNNFQKHILRPLPGCVRTQIADFNGDGKQDILALFAQGDEGFFVYLNQGNGVFKEVRIMQFHPSFGSNYFETVDFNGDGFLDILATNGDNGDYPPILKSYHGIRIYLNDGNNQFKEKVFLPINGASKAMSRDFDGDGDFDIASIAYFPDYENTPHESFIYWENKGNFKFEPFSFNESAIGRWLTMDVNDIDKDGNPDILLGNARLTFGSVPKHIIGKWDQYSPSVILLKNNKIKVQ